MSDAETHKEQMKELQAKQRAKVAEATDPGRGLILVHTGKMPTKRTYEMICFYMIGLADLEELEAHISKLTPKVA